MTTVSANPMLVKPLCDWYQGASESLLRSYVRLNIEVTEPEAQSIFETFKVIATNVKLDYKLGYQGYNVRQIVFTSAKVRALRYESFRLYEYMICMVRSTDDDKFGLIWKSKALLGKMTGIDSISVYRSLGDLQKAGLIVPVVADGKDGWFVNIPSDGKTEVQVAKELGNEKAEKKRAKLGRVTA